MSDRVVMCAWCLQANMVEDINHGYCLMGRRHTASPQFRGEIYRACQDELKRMEGLRKQTHPTGSVDQASSADGTEYSDAPINVGLQEILGATQYAAFNASSSSDTARGTETTFPKLQVRNMQVDLSQERDRKTPKLEE